MRRVTWRASGSEEVARTSANLEFTPVDVLFDRLGPKRVGAVDRCGDFGARLATKVAAELRRNLDRQRMSLARIRCSISLARRAVVAARKVGGAFEFLQVGSGFRASDRGPGWRSGCPRRPW